MTSVPLHSISPSEAICASDVWEGTSVTHTADINICKAELHRRRLRGNFKSFKDPAIRSRALLKSLQVLYEAPSGTCWWGPDLNAQGFSGTESWMRQEVLYSALRVWFSPCPVLEILHKIIPFEHLKNIFTYQLLMTMMAFWVQRILSVLCQWFHGR